MATEEHWLEVWRYPAGLVDETAITTGWLPTSGAGWENVSGQCKVAGFEESDGNGSARAQMVILSEGRASWPDELPMAIVEQHYHEATGLGSRRTVVFGYLHGDGEQSYDGQLGRGTRTLSYAGRWEAIPLPGLQFGRRNLMLGATFDAAKSVAPLATPASEVQYAEYVSQADVTGAAGIDGSADSAVVSSLTAAQQPPTSIGDTVYSGRPIPRIFMAYGGRSSRTRGAGGETIAIGLTCRAQHIAWGTFENPAAVPAFHESAAGPTYPAQITSQNVNTFFQAGAGRNGTMALRVRCKAGQSPDPNVRWGIQWNTGGSWINLPVRVRFWVRAGSQVGDNSVGKLLRVTVKGASPQDGNAKIINPVLTATYQKYEVDLDSSGTYGGVMLRFQNETGQVSASDCVFELDDLEILFGYNDELNVGYRLGIAYDNGAGVVDRLGIFTMGLIPGNFVIPPEGRMFIVDDPVAFKAKFDAGDALVVSLATAAPEFYFAPGVGKVKLTLPMNANRHVYTATEQVIEEINFGALSWSQGANPQSLRRQSPSLTGGLVAVDYPTLDLFAEYMFGPSYWTYDLGAFVPPKLDQDLPQALSAGGFIAVTDHRYYPAGLQLVAVENELIAYDLVEEGRLRIVTRGVNPAGGTFAVGHAQGPAAHLGGASVIPWRNGAPQIGHLVSMAEIRRRAGRAAILGGRVLYSNSIAPPNPSPAFELTVGGDWKVFGVFTNQNGEVMQLPAPGDPWGAYKYVEARWICVVITDMAYHSGRPQRGKFNEALAWEYLPGAGNLGNYQDRAVGNLADMVGHLLVAWGGLPATKYLPGPATYQIPIAATPVNAGTLQAAIDAATRLGNTVLRVDALGYARLTPHPTSPFFSAPPPERTFTVSDARDRVAVRWAPDRQVSQVQLVAREVAALRVHAINYPDIPGRRGKVIEVKDLTVQSITMARAHARALFRQGNVRRTPPLTVGYVPDLALYGHHVVDLPDVDSSAQVVGINVWVASYRVTIAAGPQGSIRWRTSLDLTELAL